MRKYIKIKLEILKQHQIISQKADNNEIKKNQDGKGNKNRYVKKYGQRKSH